MNRNIFACAALVATVSSMQIQSDPNHAVNLIETANYQIWGNTPEDTQCCCYFTPCMDACMSMCTANKALPLPPILPPIPREVGKAILDMDVNLEHLYHKVRREADPVPDPVVDTVDIKKFIQTYMSPVVLTLMANDVAPVLPACTDENGHSYYLTKEAADHENPHKTVPDPNTLLLDTFAKAVETLEISGSLNQQQRDALSKIDPQAMIAGFRAESDDHEHQVKVFVESHRTEWSDDVQLGDFNDDGTYNPDHKETNDYKESKDLVNERAMEDEIAGGINAEMDDLNPRPVGEEDLDTEADVQTDDAPADEEAVADAE